MTCGCGKAGLLRHPTRKHEEGADGADSNVEVTMRQLEFGEISLEHLNMASAWSGTEAVDHRGARLNALDFHSTAQEWNCQPSRTNAEFEQTTALSSCLGKDCHGHLRVESFTVDPVVHVRMSIAVRAGPLLLHRQILPDLGSSANVGQRANGPLSALIGVGTFVLSQCSDCRHSTSQMEQPRGRMSVHWCARRPGANLSLIG